MPKDVVLGGEYVMLRKTLVALGMFAAATGAQATVMTSFAPGALGVQAGETSIANFDTSFGGGVLVNAGYYTGLTSGIAAPPAGDTSQYLAVLANGSASYSFAPASAISFDVGSIDSFNTIYVSLFGSSTPITFSGSAINSNTANGDQFSPITNGRLTIYGSANERFSGISFASSGYSFELDNLAVTAPVPELTTWAMFLVGFGALGFATRRKRDQIGFEVGAL